ncbi:CYTH domain-containing protein [Candidatus Poribacteria bacterium]|nr:CYTH domain-containing protein [Candidatus Poribacteria bacterium]
MIEVEAKFQAESPQVFNQIRLQKQVAGYTLSDHRNTPQQDTYLDTTTGLLTRNGAALRIRQKILTAGVVEERIQLVTFKAQTEDIYTYTELEMPITDQQVQALLSGNLEKVHVEAVEVAVKHLKEEKVAPILHVENCRETWHLNAEAGGIEVCLDEVQYVNMDRTESVQEYGVELELKTGEPAFLEQIADALSQQYDLIPTFQSKYERGVRLLNVFGVKAEN